MNFIDKSFNQILVNKIKIEVKTALDTEVKKLLKDVNGEQVIKVTESKDNINDVFIKSLNDEIAFSRGELENRNCIIKLLVNERSNNSEITKENGTSVPTNVQSNIVTMYGSSFKVSNVT